MTEREYTIILDRDEEEGGYTVTVPALPGCSTQGQTREEAIAMARDAIQGYIAATGQGWTADPGGARAPASAHDQCCGMTAERLGFRRHRFGYRLARTEQLHRLAQIVGHAAVDTTLRYVRGTRQDRQQAVETIAWA